MSREVNMRERKVVITGIGIVSPAGNDPGRFWTSLLAGKSSVLNLDRAGFQGKYTAAQIQDFNVEDYLPRKESRRMDRFVQYACAAARMAWEDSGCQAVKGEKDRIGVWVGSGLGGMETFENQYELMLHKGTGGVNPFFLPMFIPNMAAGQIAIMTGAQGPCGCSVDESASGSHSIVEAYHLIKNNEADLMLAGGSEAPLTPAVLSALDSWSLLAEDDQHPEKACRPFDKNRRGLILGEGSGIVLMEEMNHALERGGKIYAELTGYGYGNANRYGISASEQYRPASALQAAMKNAGLIPAQIDFVQTNAHGGKKADAEQARLIQALAQADIFVTSGQAVTGHCLGATSAIDFIAALLSLENNCLPAIKNLDFPDPDCPALDYVTSQPLKRELRNAVSLCLNLDGTSMALAASKWF